MFRQNIAEIKAILRPEHLADVNRLDQQTALFNHHGLQEGGYEERVNQGYGSVIKAYALLHTHQIWPQSRRALDRAADMLLQNAEDEATYRPELSKINNTHPADHQAAWDAASKHADEKISELYQNGQAIIISGNRRHATIVRLSLDPQGQITCATYNAGGEGQIISSEGGQNILAVERHQKLRNPQDVKGLIVNHAIKSVLDRDNPSHPDFKSAIENHLEPPHFTRPGIGQNWGNCAARSPREFITGICREAGQPELADGIRDMAVGGIEDQYYDPQQLHRNISHSLEALENKTHEQFISEVIERNQGLPAGFGEDGTRRQIENAYSVTRNGSRITLEIHPPASPGIATSVENRIRGGLYDKDQGLVSREGNTLSWDVSVSHLAASAIQDYIGEKRMDSLRAEAFQNAYGTPGQPPRYAIQWGQDGMTATDKQTGQQYSYSKRDVDALLLERNPKPFMDRLIDEGAKFKQTAGRGVHVNAMDKVEMNGLQRNVVTAMTAHGYLSEDAYLGGKPRGISITDKAPPLASYALFHQQENDRKAQNAAPPDHCRPMRIPPQLRQPSRDDTAPDGPPRSPPAGQTASPASSRAR